MQFHTILQGDRTWYKSCQSMQHRYVANIGDYLKLSLLKAISDGRHLGVAWWLHPDEDHVAAGGHTSYLSDPKKWRGFDPEVFDHLCAVLAQQRHITGLESATFLSGCRFTSDLIPQPVADRARWVEQAQSTLDDCDVIFFDPDNGLEPATFRPGTKEARKSISIGEIAQFKRDDRSLLVYHHQTRRAGGHIEEIRHWSSRLSKHFAKVDVIRCKPYSPRVYFLLDAPEELQTRVQRLCDRWGERMCWNPHIPN